MAWIAPTFTDVPGAGSVLQLLGELPPVRKARTEAGYDRTIGLALSATEFAQQWKSVLDDDTKRVHRTPAVRNARLIALFLLLEHHRRGNYPAVRAALGAVQSASGRPLSVIGTRCEIASRAGEGLYLEARRTPRDPATRTMLQCVEQLFSAALTDCQQRDRPEFVRRWRGMRGVCRLMLADDGEPSDRAELQRLRDAADDLETAFWLGNRGASAAGYLLDSLIRILALEYSADTSNRIQQVLQRCAPMKDRIARCCSCSGATTSYGRLMTTTRSRFYNRRPGKWTRH
jgi:hypothetical protein